MALSEDPGRLNSQVSDHVLLEYYCRRGSAKIAPLSLDHVISTFPVVAEETISQKRLPIACKSFPGRQTHTSNLSSIITN